MVAASSLLAVAGAIIIWRFCSRIWSLHKNIARAKATDLPYFISPFDPVNELSQLFSVIWIPLWKLFTPRKYWDPIYKVCDPCWAYKHCHSIFEEIGHDTYLLVSPRRIGMTTNDPEVIHQITSRREAFPKPVVAYKLLEMFGANLVTTEGNTWRLHRKITSPSFTEANTAFVFNETVKQSQGLIEHWFRNGQTDKITSLEDDTMNLALNVIGYVGFGLRLLWPHQQMASNTDARMSKYTSHEVPEGFDMTFRDSIARVLKNILVLYLVPDFLLDNLPFAILKSARTERDNFDNYMRDFLKDKAENLKQGNKEDGMDIMGALVATSYEDAREKTGNKGSKGIKGAKLSDDNIIGNAFVMFLAGHETSANILHFTMVQLANNPAAQRQVQEDIDRIFQGQDPKNWNYSEKINLITASTIATSMNETLRMMPPVVELPKMVSAEQDQSITLRGQQHTIPRGSYVGLVLPGAHRHPGYWPTKPSKITHEPHDMNDWLPERWHRTSSKATEQRVVGADTEDFGGFAGPDTSKELYRPVRGSFLPFSDGARACVGRRIAQVEILTTLAVIFQKYSLENTVDEWASDEEVDRMSRDEREELYARATKRSRDTLAGAWNILSLNLHGSAHCPVRLVPRGEERFVSWIDSDLPRKEQ